MMYLAKGVPICAAGRDCHLQDLAHYEVMQIAKWHMLWIRKQRYKIIEAAAAVCS